MFWQRKCQTSSTCANFDFAKLIKSSSDFLDLSSYATNILQSGDLGRFTNVCRNGWMRCWTQMQSDATTKSKVVVDISNSLFSPHGSDSTNTLFREFKSRFWRKNGRIWGISVRVTFAVDAAALIAIPTRPQPDPMIEIFLTHLQTHKEEKHKPNSIIFLFSNEMNCLMIWFSKYLAKQTAPSLSFEERVWLQKKKKKVSLSNQTVRPVLTSWFSSSMEWEYPANWFNLSFFPNMSNCPSSIGHLDPLNKSTVCRLSFISFWWKDVWFDVTTTTNNERKISKNRKILCFRKRIFFFVSVTVSIFPSTKSNPVWQQFKESSKNKNIFLFPNKWLK